MKKICVVVLALTIGLFICNDSPAAQGMNITQPVNGYSNGDWSFMTAWNLSNGLQEISASWYSGVHTFTHSSPFYGQWIARFVYDSGTAQTRALIWMYGQVHVQ